MTADWQGLAAVALMCAVIVGYAAWLEHRRRRMEGAVRILAAMEEYERHVWSSDPWTVDRDEPVVIDVTGGLIDAETWANEGEA